MTSLLDTDHHHHLHERAPPVHHPVEQAPRCELHVPSPPTCLIFQSPISFPNPIILSPVLNSLFRCHVCHWCQCQFPPVYRLLDVFIALDVGDLVILQMGNRVPADIRIVQAYSDLNFDPSLLTGERCTPNSLPFPLPLTCRM